MGLDRGQDAPGAAEYVVSPRAVIEDEPLLSKPDTTKGQLQRVLYEYLLKKEKAGEIPAGGDR